MTHVTHGSLYIELCDIHACVLRAYSEDFTNMCHHLSLQYLGHIYLSSLCVTNVSPSDINESWREAPL
jgi:hypothetical protein